MAAAAAAAGLVVAIACADAAPRECRLLSPICRRLLLRGC
jgi:hypothetical protein